MKTINVTIELLDEQQIYDFEKFIRKEVTVKDFIILPDTKELYENDLHFKDITKQYYAIKRIRNTYINEHNF